MSFAYDKLLSIQDECMVGGNCFYLQPPPPPTPNLFLHPFWVYCQDNMGLQRCVSFCLATPVWKDVETFFPTFFSVAFCTLTLTGLNIFFVANMILSITIKLMWPKGFFSKQSSANTIISVVSNINSVHA